MFFRVLCGTGVGNYWLSAISGDALWISCGGSGPARQQQKVRRHSDGRPASTPTGIECAWREGRPPGWRKKRQSR
jgi:hypothetical protein